MLAILRHSGRRRQRDEVAVARICLVNRGRAMNPMTKATIQKPGPTAAANPGAIPTARKLRLTFPVRLWHHRSPPCGGFRP